MPRREGTRAEDGHGDDGFRQIREGITRAYRVPEDGESIFVVYGGKGGTGEANHDNGLGGMVALSGEVLQQQRGLGEVEVRFKIMRRSW